MNENKYYELTQDQNDLFQFILSLPISGLNLATKIVVESPLDEELALKALRFTVMNLPYCRLQLHKNEDGTGVQYLNENPGGIELIDLSDKSEKYIDKYILKMGRKAFPNKGIDVPLYNFKLIRGNGGNHIIFFNVLHIIADAYALLHIVSYFNKVYDALLNGKEIPPSKCDLDKLIEDVKKHDNPIKIEKHNEYVRTLFATEPHFTSVNGIHSSEFVKGKRYGKKQSILQYKAATLRRSIPAELVCECSELSIQMKVPPMIFYILAYRTFCGFVSETNDVMFVSTASRRATLIQKNGGLSIAHLFLNRSIISTETTFENALTQLNIIQNDGYRHADVHITEIQPQEEYRLGTPKNCCYTSSVFTYLQIPESANSSIKFRIESLGFGELAMPLYINMLMMSTNEDCIVDYYYAFRYIKKENINRYHDFMLKFLEAGIKNPSRSIRELTEESL